MADRAAQAVVRRFWGDKLPIEAESTPQMAPIERYMQYRRINSRGWTRIIQNHGPDGAQQYRDAMRALGKELGLED